MFGVHERRYGTHPLRLVLHKRATAWATRPCAQDCAGTDGKPCCLRSTCRARPIPPTVCGAPPTGYSTSRARSRLTGFGSAASRIYRSPAVAGPTCALSRTWPANSSWAGTCSTPCSQHWSRRRCSARGGQYCGNAYQVLLHR